ncbi:hypothetical protein BOX15_Mlig018322g2 [Macrostomum lignano]|uniref:Uncharacterized protein n=1 Tax=Macrostomum lignano TaxID=282301 RepID=A0A267D9R8_9PLAT|nr:hypothetical protein BOX15_Mlig018322g2 [Macrostomum lignano]
MAESGDSTEQQLFQTAAQLAAQFEKVINKIKEQEPSPAPAVTAGAASGKAGGQQQQRKRKTQKAERHHKHEQQQQQQHQQEVQQLFNQIAMYMKNCQQLQQPPQQQQEQQQQQQQPQQKREKLQTLQRSLEPQPVATNASNLAGSGRRVVTEPSELRLVLQLDSWIAENGSLVVRPSVRQDRGGNSVEAEDAEFSLQFPGGAPARSFPARQQPQRLRGGPFDARRATPGSSAAGRKLGHDFPPAGDNGYQLNNHHDDDYSDDGISFSDRVGSSSDSENAGAASADGSDGDTHMM